VVRSLPGAPRLRRPAAAAAAQLCCRAGAGHPRCRRRAHRRGRAQPRRADRARL